MLRTSIIRKKNCHVLLSKAEYVFFKIECLSAVYRRKIFAYHEISTFLISIANCVGIIFRYFPRALGSTIF